MAVERMTSNNQNPFQSMQNPGERKSVVNQQAGFTRLNVEGTVFVAGGGDVMEPKGVTACPWHVLHMCIFRSEVYAAIRSAEAVGWFYSNRLLRRRGLAFSEREGADIREPRVFPTCPLGVRHIGTLTSQT